MQTHRMQYVNTINYEAHYIDISHMATIKKNHEHNINYTLYLKYLQCTLIIYCFICNNLALSIPEAVHVYFNKSAFNKSECTIYLPS